MSDNADIVRRMSEEVFIKDDASALDQFLADEFTSHDAPPGFPGTKDGFRQLAEMVCAAFSNRHFEFDEMVDATDGRVVENWAMIGTHTGEAFGVPASNQEIRVRGIEIFRFSGGKVVEHWGSIDMSDFFIKAGPPPG